MSHSSISENFENALLPPIGPPEIEIAKVCFSQSLLTTVNQMKAPAEIRHAELGRGVREECGVQFGGKLLNQHSIGPYQNLGRSKDSELNYVLVHGPCAVGRWVGADRNGGDSEYAVF